MFVFCLSDVTFPLKPSDWFSLSDDNNPLIHPLPSFYHAHSEIVSLSNNLLQSTIPNWISEWNQLTTLVLDNNDFSGTLPSSLYNLSALRKFMNVIDFFPCCILFSRTMLLIFCII